MQPPSSGARSVRTDANQPLETHPLPLPLSFETKDYPDLEKASSEFLNWQTHPESRQGVTSYRKREVLNTCIATGILIERSELHIYVEMPKRKREPPSAHVPRHRTFS